METVRFSRSPTRLFLIGLAGVVLLLAALDVVWQTCLFEDVFDRCLSEAPEVNDDGTTTTRGLADRRSDVLWGAVLLASGLVMLAFAVVGLGVPRPAVEFTGDGLRLAIGGPRRMVEIAWDNIVSIRSGSDDDETWPSTRILLVTVIDREGLPDYPWAAEWRGNVLAVDAESWETPPEVVALEAQVQLERNL